MAQAKDSSRTVVILDVHAQLSPGVAPVDPRVSHGTKMDLDGDLGADLTCHILFDHSGDGPSPPPTTSRSAHHQHGGARSGALGEEIIQSQGHRFFAGPRRPLLRGSGRLRPRQSVDGPRLRLRQGRIQHRPGDPERLPRRAWKMAV